MFTLEYAAAHSGEMLDAVCVGADALLDEEELDPLEVEELLLGLWVDVAAPGRHWE
jgi:hypothetical protein